MKKILYAVAMASLVLVCLSQLFILVNKLRPIAIFAEEAFQSDDNLSGGITPKPSDMNEYHIEYSAPFEPDRIVIEKASVDLPVIKSTFTKGTWPVKKGVANFAEGTSLINVEKGNVGIFGHDFQDTFAGIKLLQIGDSVSLYGGEYRATYKVFKTAVIEPSQVDVFYESSEPILTLVTCQGVFAEKRYMVVSKLQTVEKSRNNIEK